MQKITPFFWFDNQAEEAAKFYTSIFKNSKMGAIVRQSGGDTVASVTGRPEGSILTVDFELEGQEFAALNGGPVFKFNEAVSFVVNCDSQEEVDYYWEKLTEGGDPKAQQCGWLKDKFGVSWQVVPTALTKLLAGEKEAAARTMQVMMEMKKLDIVALEAAYAGK